MLEALPSWKFFAKIQWFWERVFSRLESELCSDLTLTFGNTKEIRKHPSNQTNWCHRVGLRS
jgi:hypothetical protein